LLLRIPKQSMRINAHTRFIEGIKGHLTVIMSYVLSASEQN